MTERMNIALVIERMDTGRGGRETSTAQIAQALAARGHRVTILCQSGSWRGENVSVKPLGREGLGRTSRLRHFVSSVGQAVAEERFDIVHSMLPLPGANVYQPRGGTIPGQGAAARQRWGWAGPLRRLLEPLNPCRMEMARLERRVAADENVLCLPVSQMVAQEFQDHYGRQRNVQVIYNAVEIPQATQEQRAQWRQELRSKLRMGPRDVMFLTLARNFALKGVAETVRYFARWYHRRSTTADARLVVIGQEAYEGYLRLAAMREVAAKVAFLPPAEDVFRWYSAADACILLSWYDPCSRVVLEATRWQVPSITTRCNGAAEVLAAGAGLVVPSPRDGRAVVAAMETLADPQERQRRSQACAQAADHLSMARHVQELLTAYEGVAKR